MTRRKLTNIIGATIALTGVALAVGVNVYLQNIRWLPLNLPLALFASTAELPFKINYPASYYIDIEGLRSLRNESERMVQHHRLTCLLGLTDPYPEPHACDDAPRAIDFGWELLADGKVLQHGEYATQLRGAWSDDAIDAQFSHFRGKSGNYTLRLTNIQMGNSLRRYTPRIRVQLENDYYVGHAILGLASMAVGSFLLLSGLGVLAVCEFAFRKRAKRLGSGSV